MQGLPQHIGPFEVVSKLGHGGMGVVYKGYDRELHRHVAIKCLADQFADDESVATRFLREARSVATLSHPNIVPVYTAGEDNGRPYFAMEYIEGESLADRLKRENPLPVTEAVRIVMATAQGLQAAHEAKLTHRDIKPSNLLLDDKGRVRIADFGIARLEGLTRLTATSGLVGTPGYIAPEAIAGESNDHRCDIFSLGVVFYEMLTGRAPFTQTSPVQMWRAAVEANYPDVREVNAEVDEATRAIIDRMLAPKPDDRFQSCDEVIGELEKHYGRDGTPIPTSAQAQARSVERTQELPPGDTATAHTTGRKPGPALGAVVALALVAIAAGATAYLTQFRDRGADDRGTGQDQPAASEPERVSGKPESNGGNVAGWLLGRDDATQSSTTDDISTAVAEDRNTTPGPAAGDNPSAPGASPQTASQTPIPDSGSNDHATADPQTPALHAGNDAGTAPAGNRPGTRGHAPPGQGSSPAVAAGASEADDREPAARADRRPAAEDADDDTAAAAAGPAESADEDLRTASAEPQPSMPNADKVVVMAVGDPTIAGPVESELENALRSSGHKILNEQFISGIGQHVRGEGVDMAPLRGLLHRQGARILVLVQAMPVGQRQLYYSGRSQTAYSSRIDVRIFDLGTATRLDGWQKQIEFTSLNATDQAERAMQSYLHRLTTQLSRYRG